MFKIQLKRLNMSKKLINVMKRHQAGKVSMNVKENEKCDAKMSYEEIVQKSKDYTFFSWSIQSKINPIPMEKSKGCWFWDVNGKKYFDLNSQLMCSNIGHSHPKVIQAIKDQADKLTYAGPMFATQIRAEVGPLIAKHTPGDLKKFFFTLGGAEAVENGIKMARFYTKRNKLMVRYRSYHGATAGSIALTGDSRRWPTEPGLPGVVRTFDPYMYRSFLYKEGMPEEEFSEKILGLMEEQLMYENPESFAAIILETVTGSNGILPPPKGYLQGVRKLCDKYGILLFCDEVMCGLGRTGTWYAVDNYGVVPDILTTAKGITSAYLPLGAVMVNSKIAKMFDDQMLYCGLTYQSHPMSLAACKAVLEVMEEEDIIGNTQRMGKVMRSLMDGLMKKHPSVGEVRNIGLFGCLELVKNRKTKEPMAPYCQSSEPMLKLMGYLRENGVFAFNHSNLLHTNPPLCVNEGELKHVFDIIDKGLDITDKYIL